ncbi:hypothetical protein [Marinicella litoralis]|uniref:Uncharacterized protein n=1 Tax=Marinicella litoralis TaxID=644220 RepID=A0A4R6XY93_9GAMM|nr:hypothetical protein [Marinicella litoralis]TDR23480.1 hypothetical protein C8D91_0342 [Marinicella litoralis]
MSDSIGSDVFIKMKFKGFIDSNNQFKQGMLMNDEGKRLLIKKVFPSHSQDFIDVYIEYAHVVSVNGQLKADPAVVLGFDLRKQKIYPVLYRNDLLDHSIHVYEAGNLNEDNAEWLLNYWSDWFNELNADEYDHIEQAELMVG